MSDEGLRLTEKEIKYISLFEAATGAAVVDCIDNEILLTFVVKKGDIAKALSKKGEKIQELSRIFKKKIKVIEHSDDPAEFIKNAIMPARLMGQVRMTEKPDGKKIAVATVNPKDKGIAIGRGGKNIDLVRMLAKRNHGIDHIIVQ